MQPIRLAIIITALVVIGAGIYAIVGTGGNTLTADVSGGNQCEAAVARAETLDPLVKGEIAAFQVADTPHYIGNQAFKDIDGKDKTLADWTGRTVLLNLWATWCAPCRREMPALQALEVAEGGDDFQVVPVSVDLGEPGKPRKFYQDNNLNDLPFFADGTMGVFNNLKKQGLAFGMPSTLLLDENSCVLGVLNGPAEWASEDAVNLIRAAKKLAG